jgi:hypothetical protein
VTEDAITSWEYDVLAALKTAADSDQAKASGSFDVQKGWLTGTQIIGFSSITGPNIRPALNLLRERGFIDTRSHEWLRLFRINQRGIARLEQGKPRADADLIFSSYAWTGVVDPVQAQQVLAILAEMEDVCEQISNNHDRAQIYGLIRAIEVLLTIPEPPRQGLVALVRDPAFANIVQVATFLAALIAAVRP